MTIYRRYLQSLSMGRLCTLGLLLALMASVSISAPGYAQEGPYLLVNESAGQGTGFSSYCGGYFVIGYNFQSGEDVHVEATLTLASGEIVRFEPQDVQAGTGQDDYEDRPVGELGVVFDYEGDPLDTAGSTLRVTAVGDEGSTTSLTAERIACLVLEPGSPESPVFTVTGANFAPNGTVRVQADLLVGCDYRQAGFDPVQVTAEDLGAFETTFTYEGDPSDLRSYHFDVVATDQAGTSAMDGVATDDDCGGGEPDTESVTKTSRLTLYGEAPPEELFGVELWVLGEDGLEEYGNQVILCAPSLYGEPVPVCEGDGSVYTRSTSERYVSFSIPPGSTVKYSFFRGENPNQRQRFLQGTETLHRDMTNAAWYDFATGTGGTGDGPAKGDIQDDQQGGSKPTVPDNQQEDTEDAKRDNKGADQSPNNQQSGSEEDTVTKTFELTLNGTVPEGEAFVVRFGVADGDEGNTDFLYLCGERAQDECAGAVTVYSGSLKVPAGTRIDFAFVRTATGEVFHEGTETIHDDMTNTAWYTFGNSVSAGDDQQDDTQDGGAGGGNDQQDGTQDDAQDTGTGAHDGTQDDHQIELPEKMPETGAGGMTAGATLPVSNALGGLAVMLLAVWSLVCKR